MWHYKNFEISVDGLGMFCFVVDGTVRRRSSLQGAKEEIDSITEEHYKITTDFVRGMCKKLTGKESEFVLEMIRELSRHVNSAYCEQDISEDFPFNVPWEEFADFKLRREGYYPMNELSKTFGA